MPREPDAAPDEPTEEEYAERFIGDGSEFSFEGDPDFEEIRAELVAEAENRRRRIQDLIAKHGAEWDRAAGKTA
jgi:hypothetical protein